MYIPYFRHLLTVCFLLTIISCSSIRKNSSASIQRNPKREFRGAWIQTVHQEEYQRMTPAQMKADFIRKLDFLSACGINAIIFQVRPEADAFYQSNIEPWSRFLTGEQGKAPEGNFDPMAFMIAECHKRCMEFHAWLNPYRVSTSGNTKLADSHIYHRYPQRFVTYNNQILFDPGLPENRQYICRIVRDIVTRYEVDAIHMDDYFYPYPAAGEPFPDDESFRRYGKQQGYSESQRGDWRRENVNLLVSEIKHTILLAKPWVRFGISPFGIYRNKKSTPDGSGSNTNGLQNYDDLYADVLHWEKQGWIDYTIPQIYWEIGHQAANYTTLAKWWARNNRGGHLYIGQDVSRTMKADQLTDKMFYERTLPHVKGNCFWPANEILWNNKGVADSLKRHYHRHPALIPAYTHLHKRSPDEVEVLYVEKRKEEYFLSWGTGQNRTNPEFPCYFVIYKFARGEKINLNDPSKIIAITSDKQYKLPYEKGEKIYTYVVTAVDRFHNESKKGKRKKIKL
ncbi:family 10 glycosylhydrolase [Parabacteroides sp. PF5-9]|uniref:glycoside hydrolase family 10 protein n=1 Tax=Parabacteroides sp. PF5-9 TaxID=1742404 RepID=UPI0024771F6F|nr:family 10 glycosylhydrolase [Parabacteroides sp. PF5-9]MDH6356725.1 uncharacterized lipoprotein YddW (UPF0748 family) [Parabacteroides sp. PF5-9]